MEYIEEKRKTPIVRKVDVVVIGGGPAGFGAAIAAAKTGAKTLLIERYGFIGGMLTGGLVIWLPIDKLTPLKQFGEKQALQGGVIEEFVSKLRDAGGATDPAGPYPVTIGLETYFPTDPEICKVIMLKMVEDSGAEMLLHSFAVDVVKEGNKPIGVIVENKSGRQAILAQVIVDCSGDADMAAAAGAEYDKSEKPLMMTLQGVLANVDIDKATKFSIEEGKEEFDRLVEKAIEKGDLVISKKEVLPRHAPVTVTPMNVHDHSKLPANWYRRGEAVNWIESVLGDSTNVNDLTRAEIVTRKTVLSVTNFFRKYIPGYEHCYIANTGIQIGVRESRRVLGGYFLTFDKDMQGGLKQADVITKCRAGAPRDMATLSPEQAPIFDIPYRCLVPKTIDNLLVAGRCISIDHKAATVLSPRDEATCVCLGQAAGTAAALSVKAKVSPRNLDIKALQQTLRKHGANV